ncbi:MAG: error-prone DNA polymerase [Gammaproteobacteria bacterium]|nr:error-prone DNA polymerase [Gammaproteobacteria bacterium]
MSQPYAELHCLSNFSFLRGASHPEELVARAHELGYAALAITDECSLGGAVRAHMEARRRGLPLIIGSEIRLEDGLRLVLLATSREGYAALSALITRGRRAAAKGSYRLTRDDLTTVGLDECLALWLPGAALAAGEAAFLAECFPGRLWIAVELLLAPGDAKHLESLRELGRRLRLPLVAAGDVHMHRRGRRALQDTLTAIRLGKPVQRLGTALFANGERHLRSRDQLAGIYPPALLAQTMAITERCDFSLNELRYEYPGELVPAGHTPISWLRSLTENGAAARWPQEGVPDRIRRQLDHELALIEDLGYEPYFLTVHDIVAFARSRGILCQGRGSAANSAVCYCLGITEVDPARMNLLFERFISRERGEPPDIDVDFEHERREEVIQYIYRKYGRERAALAATVITYQPRSAVRDVGKALGFSPDQVDHLAKSIQWWDRDLLHEEAVNKLGITGDHPRLRQLLVLVEEILGFPRHLSQHVGGFVIAQDELSRLVPVENAAMPERTVIQWEKDDLEALGLLKVDVLGLGMLSAIRRALGYLSTRTGRTWTLADIPAEDPGVYDMLCEADTIGVFQVESRAQMSMLPRLRPRRFYDLVIQIAIVRPGPIQGDMVHPYLRRRGGLEPVSYPSAEVRKVLARTLGVPIFQEQVMQLSIAAAGFTPGEADQLRRSMAAWKKRGGLEKFQKKLTDGMLTRGYSERFADQICRQIQGFGEYGFPESHSASFALLAYVSSWLKRYHPAEFTCALLNSQPMGFYAPAQLVQDARRHGVEVRPVDIHASGAEASLEGEAPGPVLRIGLNQVKGLSQAAIERIVSARCRAPFNSVGDLKRRARLQADDIEALAAADALRPLAGHRHKAFWEVAGSEAALPLFPAPRFNEAEPLLPVPAEIQDIAADYDAVGLSLRRHPIALLRGRLERLAVHSAAACRDLHDGAAATAAGLVICRQRPGSASGVIFITLEDETGHINVVVWPQVAARQRRVLLQSKLMAVRGVVQLEQDVLHLVAGRLTDYSGWLGELRSRSRDFR